MGPVSENTIMESVQNLLLHAGEIVRRHEALARSRGANFHVFEILDRATDEVRGHSAVLACLLDPKGVHGQGALFLNLFFQALREFVGQSEQGEGLAEEGVSESCIRMASASSETEEVTEKAAPPRWGATYSRKFLDENVLNGRESWTVSAEERLPWSSGPDDTGRIDLTIRCKCTMIIVENKIYAHDQQRQLERYHKYGKIIGQNVLLIYLTLDGAEPSETSRGTVLRENVLLLDYGSFIVGWIENCIQAVALLPHIRETLYQYRRLLQRLTQRGDNREMTMEIVELVRQNAEMLDAALEVGRSLPEVKTQVQLAFWKQLEARLRFRLDVEEGRLAATYKDDKVREYYTATRGAPKWFGLSLQLPGQKSAPVFGLAVTVDQNLYYEVFGPRDGQVPPRTDEFLREKARDSGGEWLDVASGRTIIWRYPSPEWRLNFRHFDKNCVRLADAKRMEEYVYGVAEDVFLVWQELHNVLPVDSATAIRV